MSLSQPVRRFAFGQGVVLWDGWGSRLFVYNDTMRLLCPSLAKGTTIGELAAILVGTYDVDRQRALADAAALLEHLQSEGLLEGSRDERVPPEATGAAELSDADGEIGSFTTRINGTNIRIGAIAATAEFLRPLFPEPQWCGGAAECEILCRPDGRSSLVTVDGGLRARIDDPLEVTGAILEQVIRAVNPAREWLAFLHAGSVRRNGAAIVLPAVSGSGKSTLVGFLASNGFEYLSDDLVPLVAPRGEVAACPLAINLKAGSRGLYPAPAGFEAVTFPDRFRTGQLLLPPPRLWETPPAPPRAIVFPRYAPNIRTGFAPIAPIDGLTRLFGDRVFLGYPLEEARIANFLRWAEQTPFYGLEYSELTEAARCLATLTG
ncbi:MAG: PqqD family peptide modification chaperone [Pseudomonadota bacterium]